MDLQKKIDEVDKLVYESSKIAELHREIIMISKQKVMWKSIAITLIAMFLAFSFLVIISS